MVVPDLDDVFGGNKISRIGPQTSLVARLIVESREKTLKTVVVSAGVRKRSR